MDTKPTSNGEKAQSIHHITDRSPASKNSLDTQISSIAAEVFCETNGAILTEFMPVTEKGVSDELGELNTQLQNQVIVVDEVAKGQIFTVQNNPERAHISLKIGFFCDIDAIDHNGAIAARTIFSIEQNLPFITTRSMLKGSGIIDRDKRSSLRSNLERALLKMHDKWEVFEQGEFLVFLPKSLESEKSGIYLELEPLFLSFSNGSEKSEEISKID
jgi:hypothetical protein